ncbi:hypothetical protein RvY_13455 [Ramazzottius varieornatus]|uniref:Uncharacterized protein n=1 Tax=Ramazzottius varieornatus TaxID=947166 RepID=A0A1D1VMY2_RAMVA|nr:hypothetical protein RvY_13455 [Ramazzottius varieornatus]
MQSCLNWPARFFSHRQSRVSGTSKDAQPKKLPKISIRVGMNVTRPGPYLGPKIAFIFGGPGTHKGRVLDDVAQMFGLTVISGEALILQNILERVASSTSLREVGMKLPSKVNSHLQDQVANGSARASTALRQPRSSSPSGSARVGSRSADLDGTFSEGGSLSRSTLEGAEAEGDGSERPMVPDMRGLQELLRVHSSTLTLEWLLQLVSDEIDYGVTHNASGFLIDLMPNMRHLLKCDTLIKDCWDEMEKLEEKYPILFAIDLAMPQDKLPKTGDALKNKTDAKLKSAEGKEGKDGEATTSDEMDSYRMQRRYALYESAVMNFLQYFRETGRLVSVDASSGVAELIWQKISDFLIHMDFVPKRAVNCVIILAFEEDAFLGMDISKYRMLRVRLASLVENPYAPVEDLLRQLCRFIDVSANLANAFAVELYGTSIDRHLLVNEQAKEVLRKRKLFFCEVEQVTLDRYITFASNTAIKRKPSLATRRFQAVCLPDQAACLFPSDIDPQLCRIIAAHIGQLKSDRDRDPPKRLPASDVTTTRRRLSKDPPKFVVPSSRALHNGLHR